MARNRVWPISQNGASKRGGLNKGMDTEGFCTLANACNLWRNIQNGGNKSGFGCTE